MFGILAQTANVPQSWGIVTTRAGMSFSATWFMWAMVFFILFTSICTLKFFALKKGNTR